MAAVMHERSYLQTCPTAAQISVAAPILDKLADGRGDPALSALYRNQTLLQNCMASECSAQVVSGAPAALFSSVLQVNESDSLFF